MRGFVAVVERELVERRLLAVVALVAGLLPFLVPFVSNVRHLDPVDVRSGSALAFCLTFTVVAAVVLGASVIAGDLAERRLGFYFSRPLSGAAVWGGKMAAAALLTLGGGLLVLLPAALAGGIDLGSILPGQALRADLFSLGISWVAAALFLILTSHAVSVMVRARSPWLAVDLVAAVVVGLLLWDARIDLLFARALPFAPTSWDVLAAVLVFLGLAVAGAAQVTRGRTDPRRGHRVLSLTLWGLLLLVAVAGQGLSRWMLNVSPEDLEQVTEVSSSPRGSWVAFSGPARYRGEYRPRFLLDTASGRSFRTGGWWTLFSEDGGRAVWMEPSGRSLRSPEAVLYRLDLRDPKAAPAATSITFREPFFFNLALSAGGECLASIQDRRLIVEDLGREKILASIQLPGIPGVLWQDGFLRFLDSGHVLLLQRRPLREGPAQRAEGGFEVLAAVANLAPGSSIEVRSLGKISGYPNLSLSPDGERLFIHGGREEVSRLLDVRTGREIASLTPGPETLWTSSPRFLADGRIAFRKSRQELLVFSPNLVLERTFRFKGALASEIGSQPAPGRLIVATARPGRASFSDPTPWQILLLDLTTGEVRSLASGLLPVEGPNRGPASAGSRLFRNAQGGLVSLDPATGKTRVIVPGGHAS
ncbi:MAG TPA: hypothetical protein VJ725_04625 [Thermoanaerobaculia bacterium]|nr:hypothetical protein [Thermoanaerobaculia bacterium]